ncbi:unnamed protein product [Orchesella dallaii]|uniref:Uncharacterized protein n=1 Tax=Orchesella dallaii TaxID=48710 RepID=A0ABP1QJK8_9HEXA
MVVLIALWMDLDFIYFLMEDMLPSPLHRSSATILHTLILRAVLIFHFVSELARSSAMLGTMLLIYTTTVESILTILQADNLVSMPHFFDRYSQCFIAICATEGLQRDLLIAIVGMMYWITLVGLWFVFEGYGKINDLLYFTMLMCVVDFIVTAFIVTSKIISSLDLSRTLVKKRKMEAAKGFLVARNKSNKYNLAKSKSLQCLKLRIGIFYNVDRNAVVEYCDKMAGDLINATIAFEIK